MSDNLYPSHAKLVKPEAAEAGPDQAAVFYPSHDAPTATEPLYSAGKDYAPALREGLDDLGDHLEFDPEMRTAYAEETGTLFRELGFSPMEARPLHDILVAGLKTPATPEQVKEWSRQTDRDGRYGFGKKEYEKRLILARDYLARRPTLRNMLSTSGMAANPKLVHALLSRAHALPTE